MQKYRLQEEGKEPIVFEGKILAKDVCNNEFYENIANIFKTQSNKYVVEIISKKIKSVSDLSDSDLMVIDNFCDEHKIHILKNPHEVLDLLVEREGSNSHSK